MNDDNDHEVPSVTAHLTINADEKLPMPSFIRLFVIKRTINRYILSNGGKSDELIKQLSTMLNNSDNKSQENSKERYRKLSYTIMLRLVQLGIKTYMESFYDEKEQGIIIEKIFNQIILAKLAKEYQKTTTYITSINDNDDYYQCLVFNTDDLMSCIFQFLSDFDKYIMTYDLVNCSLVNSHWLYQTWNPQSIYFVSLFELITGFDE